MTLFKSKWRTMVLMMGAIGVLMTGGAFADEWATLKGAGACHEPADADAVVACLQAIGEIQDGSEPIDLSELNPAADEITYAALLAATDDGGGNTDPADIDATIVLGLVNEAIDSKVSEWFQATTGTLIVAGLDLTTNSVALNDIKTALHAVALDAAAKTAISTFTNGADDGEDDIAADGLTGKVYYMNGLFDVTEVTDYAWGKVEWDANEVITLTASPDPVDFGAVAPGSTVQPEEVTIYNADESNPWTGTVTLTGTNNTAFEISANGTSGWGVSIASVSVAAATSGAAPGSASIFVRPKTATLAATGSFTAKISFGADPPGYDLEIVVSLVVSDFTSSPSAVAFGSVVSGGTVEAVTLTLTNNSTSSAFTGAVTLTGDDASSFEISANGTSWSGSIASYTVAKDGGENTLQVRPKSATLSSVGEYAAKVSFGTGPGYDLEVPLTLSVTQQQTGNYSIRVAGSGTALGNSIEKGISVLKIWNGTSEVSTSASDWKWYLVSSATATTSIGATGFGSSITELGSLTISQGETANPNIFIYAKANGDDRTKDARAQISTITNHTTPGSGGPPGSTATLTADGFIYNFASGGKTKRGQITLNTVKAVAYEPGSVELKALTPTIDVYQGNKDDLYVKNIMYTPQSGETGCEGGAYWPNSARSSDGNWNHGVDKVSKGVRGATGAEYNKFVACKYDVIAEVWHKPTTADNNDYLVGISTKETFVITPKLLTDGMVTVKLDETDKVYTGQVKRPIITLKDGSYGLVPGDATGAVDYRTGFLVADSSQADSWKNVGTARIVINGRNNYSGIVTKTFTIAPFELPFSTSALYDFKKGYDGTVAVTEADSARLPIKFGPYPTAVASGDELTAADYIIKAGTFKYNEKNVGTTRTVTATVELAKTAKASNYKLKSASFSTDAKQVIEKGTVTADNVNKLIATTPKLPDTGLVVKFTGKAVTVAAAWASGITNPSVTGVGDGKITVSYSTEDGKAPVADGTWDVLVSVNEGGNLRATSAPVKIGTIKIDQPGAPGIASITPDTFYYATKSVTLEVKAENPKDGKTTGLSYQWYQQADTGVVTLRGKTAAKFVVNDTATGIKQYFVIVTYKGTDQATTSTTSNIVSVEVRPAPVTIKGAIVTANTSYEYTGGKITVTGGDLTVLVGANTLSEGVDYAIKNIANNTNAGVDAAVVTLSGINGYKDEVVGTFTITRKQVTLEDLQITYGVDYTGETQEIVVRPVTGKSGLGIVTPTYTPADTARLDAGSWNVTLAIADGQNFTGIEALALTQPYTIRKVLFDEKTMLKYDSLPKDVAWNGKDQGIGAPTLEGLGKKYTGSLRVVYEKNGEDLTTAIDSGVYRVKLSIGGDKNFSAFEINLGVLTIHDKDWVGIAQKDRVIPGVVKTEEAAVAPVKTVSASVTAGPNPVASNGKVTFFWNGNTQVSGKLIVFTNVGRKVASINVKGAKEIGSWNVNGVAEGTYLVKGVLREKNGGKVGVSTVVGVTK